MFSLQWYNLVIAAFIVMALGLPALAQQDEEPEHIRGQILSVKRASAPSSMVMKTSDGKALTIGLPDELTVISLTKGSYTRVDFGDYVGSVAVKLDEYSPIVRDSLSWLHKGFELRFIDDELRGIALGHKEWDLTSDSIIAHGWVDDIEGRVLSIKYGPTEIEETDVEIPRGVPVHNMALGDKSLIVEGKNVFVGAEKGANGDYEAVFLFVGEDDSSPAM